MPDTTRTGPTHADREAATAAAPTSVLAGANPTALGIARLNRRFSFPPGGEALYRRIASLFELGSEHEFLLAGCRHGVGARYLARRTDATGAGVDPDGQLIGIATARTRERGLAHRLHFDAAPFTDLPYQDAVFDFALGEIDLGAAADPSAAVREMVRVTRPMGTVVLVQLVWTKKLDPERAGAVVRRLGVRPFMAVEWKQMLREAGVVDLHIEDWSTVAASPGQPAVLGGLAAFFSLRGKIAVLPGAWRRWGWRGVRMAFSLERELRQLFLEEKVLGVSLIKGTRWQEHAGEGDG